MKLEKIVITLGVTLFLVAAGHMALAADNTNININIKTAPQKSAAKAKKSAKNQLKKTTSKTNKVATKTTKAANATQSPKPTATLNNEIDNEIRAFENSAKADAAAAEARRAQRVGVAPTQSTSIQAGPNATSKAQLARVSVPQENPLSGSLNLTYGTDSNVDSNKTGTFQGNFFQIDPTLGFKTGNWSGSVGGSFKDYSDELVSKLARSNDGKADLNFTAKISSLTTSTTTVNLGYHDEMNVDDTNPNQNLPSPHGDNGFNSITGQYDAIASRYTEAKLTQKLDFDFGKLTSEIGGSATHRDYSTKQTDYANPLFIQELVERDYNEISGFGKIGLKAASFLELAARPSITQRNYLNRNARLANGQTGGQLIDAPKYETVTSEFAFDVGFKFGASNITPTASIGQVSDQGLGAVDGEYYGFGISSAIVLNESIGLTLSPNVSFKRTSFDHWTYALKANSDLSKRRDDELSSGISASVKVTKNLGLGMNYTNAKAESSLDDPSVNFREEIVGSSMTLSF